MEVWRKSPLPGHGPTWTSWPRFDSDWSRIILKVWLLVTLQPFDYRPQFFNMKRSKPIKKHIKNQEASSILRVVFALSEWPHLHRESSNRPLAFVLSCSWNMQYWRTRASNDISIDRFEIIEHLNWISISTFKSMNPFIHLFVNSFVRSIIFLFINLYRVYKH